MHLQAYTEKHIIKKLAESTLGKYQESSKLKLKQLGEFAANQVNSLVN